MQSKHDLFKKLKFGKEIFEVMLDKAHSLGALISYCMP